MQAAARCPRCQSILKNDQGQPYCPQCITSTAPANISPQSNDSKDRRLTAIGATGLALMVIGGVILILSLFMSHNIPANSLGDQLHSQELKLNRLYIAIMGTASAVVGAILFASKR